MRRAPSRTTLHALALGAVLGAAGCKGGGSGPATASAASPPVTRTDERGDRVPSDWVPGEMAAAVPLRGRDAGIGALETRILAWAVERDDRPFERERALLWLHGKSATDEGGEAADSYALAYVFRNSYGDRRWALASVMDAHVRPFEPYDHAPTAAELERFVASADWEFAPFTGARLVDAAVCKAAWEASFGQAPGVAFP
ncbi:MAG: hypothetical protein IT373_28045 [Polyangiaceae bacterium]|nr:hypothetical protein [Polyangiaceae bacterium]